MWGITFGSTAPVAFAIGLNYATVLFNAFGGFPLPDHPKAFESYVDSPYWVGMPRATVQVIVVFQVLALLGFVGWCLFVSLHPPTRGVLASPVALFAALMTFLIASAVWPFAAYECVKRPLSLRHAVGASVPLWVAAAAVVVLLAGTVEAQYESPIPVLGMLSLAIVVVLLDGIGWSATAIYRSSTL